MKALRLTLIVALAACLTGAAKKPKLAVRFYVEATGEAGGQFTFPAKFTNPPREGHIEAIPIASERNIEAIYPVENPDGTLGCAFLLDQSGRLALETTSKDRRGASMLVMVQTKKGTHQVIDMVIDKAINDGIIYVPRGISPGEMVFLRQSYRVMGQPKKKGAVGGI
jgi:hypothetical protein